jgi:hypothetical protein
LPIAVDATRRFEQQCFAGAAYSVGPRREAGYTISTESETNGCNTPIVVGKCWIEGKAEFMRLYARAAAIGSGLTVLMKSAGEIR